MSQHENTQTAAPHARTFPRAIAAAATLVATIALSAPASATLLTNGSFESGLTGWTTSGGLAQPDVVGTWQAHDGSRLIDLNGFMPGSILQNVATVVGQAYTLSFALSGNFSNSTDTKEVAVDVGGGATSYFFARPLGWSTANMLWTVIEHQFVATATTTTVSFTSLSDAGDFGGHNAEGAVLDNIRLDAVPTPEPGVLALAGLGLTGALARRRRGARSRA
ncbi:MAG: DUF642 domain-containing protein [Gammaproteobacteria bacterium]